MEWFQNFQPPRPLPEGISSSPVKVLKLHGSFGWIIEHDEICFEGAKYLALMDFHFNGNRLCLCDPSEPKFGVPSEFALLYPSFLKQINTKELQSVWYTAGDAILKAEEVDIWGYSLPASDSAVQVLLTPLRFRADRGEPVVIVHDPDPKTLARWRAFLGDYALYKQEKLSAE